jgi:hypothetical protein
MKEPRRRSASAASPRLLRRAGDRGREGDDRQRAATSRSLTPWPVEPSASTIDPNGKAERFIRTMLGGRGLRSDSAQRTPVGWTSITGVDRTALSHSRPELGSPS